MELFKTMMIAASGLRAQTGRMRIISENIANANSTAANPDGDPYRRRIPTFENVLDKMLNANMVKLGKPEMDKSEFDKKHDPGHPAADATGYVKIPNVNTLVEAMDMREAQRSYEANLNVIQASRRMMAQTIELLRR